MSVTVAQTDDAAVAVEFEGCLVTPYLIRTQPHDEEAFGGNGTDVSGQFPALQVVGIITQIHSREVDGLFCRIVELYPTVEIVGRTHYRTGIGSHKLVDDKGNTKNA